MCTFEMKETRNLFPAHLISRLLAKLESRRNLHANLTHTGGTGGLQCLQCSFPNHPALGKILLLLSPTQFKTDTRTEMPG